MSGLVLEGLSGEIVKQVTARILLNSLLPCFPLTVPLAIPLDQFCFCDTLAKDCLVRAVSSNLFPCHLLLISLNTVTPMHDNKVTRRSLGSRERVNILRLHHRNKGYIEQTRDLCMGRKTEAKA